MEEFFQQILSVGGRQTGSGIEEVAFSLLMALALGCVIAAIYRITQRREAPAAGSFISTLVLLTVLLAMVAHVIGKSQALSFSLVGILSIVRFRTTVEDTRDTAFVIFAVIIGMAAGVGNHNVAYLGLAVVGAAALGLRYVPMGLPASESDWFLQVRVSTGAGAATPWEDVLVKHCESKQLLSTSTAKQGTVLELTYRLRLKPATTPMQLLNEINRIEGIQNLELKKNA